MAKINAAMPITQAPLQSFNRDVNLIKGTATEQKINQLVSKRHFIGTVTLVKNNHLVYQQGFGYANKARKIKNSGKTTFQIASIQKSMTAVLLMKTAGIHHFSIDQSLSDFYPDIKNADKITLRNLLTMTSGIKNQSSITHSENADEFVNYTVRQTKIDPDEIGKLIYQPVNFVLLAGIIQQKNHQSYYSYFKNQLIKPLGLHSTYFYQDQHNYQDVQAVGYHFHYTNPYQVFNEKTTGYDEQLGTGNLYMSNGDLYQTLRAFLTSKLLTPKQTLTLYSPGKTHSVYRAGFYPLQQKIPQLIGKQYAGYHFHGAEFGYETVGDISSNGADAVIFASNSANRIVVNNYALDIPVYKQMIDDDAIY